jgi:hypothetical protein
MLKPKSIEEACQLVKLSQHLDSSIYGVMHQEHSPYTELEREPVCRAVKALGNMDNTILWTVKWHH